MNIIKHMEAAFLFTLSVAGVASVMIDTAPEAQAQPVQASASISGNVSGNLSGNLSDNQAIPVVHVTAKRLTPAEKQQLVAQEARGSRA